MMSWARNANMTFWLMLWLSDVMHPGSPEGNFWVEKGKQLFRLNSSFDDPVRLIGDGIVLVAFWFAIDWWLRRRARRSTTAPPQLPQ
jgi:hypothetical protein